MKGKNVLNKKGLFLLIYLAESFLKCSFSPRHPLKLSGADHISPELPFFHPSLSYLSLRISPNVATSFREWEGEMRLELLLFIISVEAFERKRNIDTDTIAFSVTFIIIYPQLVYKLCTLYLFIHEYVYKRD